MPKKIQIVCTNPGMRRNGIEHQKLATYALDRWTEGQLDAFRADPAFVVQEIDGDAVSKAADFDLAVATEVAKQVEAKSTALQASFDDALKAALAEKVAEAEKPLRDRIAALEAENADLKGKLDKATDKQPAAKK